MSPTSRSWSGRTTQEQLAVIAIGGNSLGRDNAPRSVKDLNAQASQEWWQAERAKIPGVIAKQKEARGF